ncbi:relaxase/mobilization nuclease domain-containing protein [Empedobacter falsenii]
MIVKNVKNKGSGTVADSVNYAQREEKYQNLENELPQEKKAECVLLNNLSSSDAKVVKAEFTEVNGENNRIKTNQKHGHEVISFSEKDIKTLDTPQKRAEVAERYLDYRGIKKDNFQYIGVEHKDTKNTHIHVIYNRVGLDGSVLKARGKFETMAIASERTEKDFKLNNDIQRKVVYAPETERGYIKNPALENKKTIIREPKTKAKSLDQKKEFVQDKINEALQGKRITNPEELKAELKKSNINYEFSVNSKGLAGGSFKVDKISFKGSQLGFKASVIEKQLKSNLEYNQTEKKNNQIAETIYKEKGAFYQTEESINRVIQQNKGIDTKSKIEELKSREPKTEQEKQINKIQIKSFEDLEVKQQKFVLELKEYKELKSQEPKKVSLLSFNKSEIIKQNEELKRKQMQAKPPSLPKYEVLNHYESIREIELRKEQKKAIFKNTYEMEKKQSLSKDQKLSNDQNQNLTEQQKRILERIAEREKEKSKDQNQEQKRNRGLRR